MGSHPYSQHSSYITGAAIHDAEGWIVMAMDHLVEQNHPNAVFLYLKGTDLEVKHSVDFKTRFAGLLPRSPDDLIAVGELGNFVVVSQAAGLVIDDIINVNGVTPESRSRGPLTTGMVVDGRVVMVGMSKQVYCREPNGSWIIMENGIPAPSKIITGFEGIAGKSLSALYAVGWEGEIWKYDGSSWSAMSSPTNDLLTAVCVAEDDRVYAVGREGALFRATNDQWEALDSEIADDLWSIISFKGEIYAASLYHLYRLNPAGALDVVDPLGCPCYGPFSTCQQALWSIGQKAVLSYNGKDWNQIA
jgi:hypothetical protein